MPMDAPEVSLRLRFHLDNLEAAQEQKDPLPQPPEDIREQFDAYRVYLHALELVNDTGKLDEPLVYGDPVPDGAAVLAMQQIHDEDL